MMEVPSLSQWIWVTARRRRAETRIFSRVTFIFVRQSRTNINEGGISFGRPRIELRDAVGTRCVNNRNQWPIKMQPSIWKSCFARRYALPVAGGSRRAKACTSRPRTERAMPAGVAEQVHSTSSLGSELGQRSPEEPGGAGVRGLAPPGQGRFRRIIEVAGGGTVGAGIGRGSQKALARGRRWRAGAFGRKQPMAFGRESGLLGPRGALAATVDLSRPARGGRRCAGPSGVAVDDVSSGAERLAVDAAVGRRQPTGALCEMEVPTLSCRAGPRGQPW